MSNRFPTLGQHEPEQKAEPNETTVAIDQLEQTTEAMRAVLAENERLKGRLVELEKRVAAVTALYNREIEKTKGRKRED